MNLTSSKQSSGKSVLQERTRLAQANLLPPEVEEDRTFKRTQRYLVYVLIGFLAVVGIVYAIAAGSVATAQGDLDKANDEQSRLRTEIASYWEVPLVLQHLETVKTAESHAMLYEIDWNSYLLAIAAVTPESVVYSELTYAGASVVEDLPEPPAGYYYDVVGAIAVAGRTSNQAEYGNWVREIDEIPGLYGTWVFSSPVNATSDGEVFWEFTGTIIISEDALLKRFDDSPADQSTDSTGNEGDDELAGDEAEEGN